MKKRYIILIIILIPVIFIIFSNIIISYTSNKYLTGRVSTIPFNKTGIILGTSKYLKTGEFNPFYRNRLEAAATLYRSKKIKYIIASGDNMNRSYNEPRLMKQDLLKLGIPENSIYLDYAGFRTLDSIVRINKIFGQTNFTIITQKFHNQRAVFIGRYYGLNAVGFNADDVTEISGFKTKIRELFAKTKAIIDLYILNKQPKYLGKKIIIE